MTAVQSTDDRVHDWLHKKLDEIPEPQRAVREAIRTAAEVRQRPPRRGVRAWLADWRHIETSDPADRTPEIILDATLPATEVLGPAAIARVAGPRRIPLAFGAALVAVVAVVSGALLVGLPGPAQVSPAGAVVRHGALILGEPDQAGREIVVAADGSGHFWTISDAVTLAVDGDRITVKPGNYRDSVAILGKDVTITGDGGPDEVIIRPTSDGPLALPAGYTSPADFDADDEFDITTWVVPDDWRYVFYLQDSDARISGLSLLGSVVGSALIIDGGAPVLEDLIIDPDGSQTDGDPLEPHEALYIYGGSLATLRNSSAYGLISIRDASAPVLSNNTITGTCVLISGAGTKPELVANVFRTDSESAYCPFFNIVINGGASPLLDTNDIVTDKRIDGIRVLGPDTAPTIQGNEVIGADVGIWLGGDARGLIGRNTVKGSRTGIKVVGSSPQVDTNAAVQNDVGVSIDGQSRPAFTDNEVCDNGTNLVLLGDAAVPMSLNPRVCPNTDPSESTPG